MDKFTIVLVSRNLNGNYFKLVMETYNRYIDYDSVYSFIIITPDDINIKKYVDFNYKRFNFKVFNDTFLLNENEQAYDGWIKQQLIKLFVCKYVETELYMILDDDVFLTRKLSFNDLYSSCKIKYNSEKYSELSTPTHSSLIWYNSSAKLLNVEENLYNKDDHLMSVTPQLFITKHVLDMLSELNNDSEWTRKFNETKASEYSLYWLYILKNNLNYKYTDECVQFWYTDDTTSLLVPVSTTNEAFPIICSGFTRNKGYFTVIQSYIGVPLNDLYQILKFIKVIIS